jgi:hypothetical protein
MGSSTYTRSTKTTPRGRTGAKILDHVAKATAENSAVVQLTLWFANDLGCEWTYVVDLDDGLFEVYHGSQYKSQATSKRFNGIGGQDSIVPDLVKSLPFKPGLHVRPGEVCAYVTWVTRISRATSPYYVVRYSDSRSCRVANA